MPQKVADRRPFAKKLRAAKRGTEEREPIMSDRLVGAQRQTALKDLHGWSEVLERDAIRKTFHFADFPAAWGFMNQVALLAEKTGHHPEWFNDLGRVEVILYTRSVDAVTTADIDFAHRLDQMAPLHDR